MNTDTIERETIDNLLAGLPETQRNALSGANGTEYRCCSVCVCQTLSPLPVGTIVTIGRDEDRWPSAGSWPRFAGRVGTIVSNIPERLDLGPDSDPRDPVFHLEYGISWSKNVGEKTGSDAYFLPHEVVV